MVFLAAILLASNITLMVHSSRVSEENESLKKEVKTLNGSADVSKSTVKSNFGQE